MYRIFTSSLLPIIYKSLDGSRIYRYVEFIEDFGVIKKGEQFDCLEVSLKDQCIYLYVDNNYYTPKKICQIRIVPEKNIKLPSMKELDNITTEPNYMEWVY